MAWIDKLVGRSPVGPMQEHMTAAVVCARQIVPLVEAMIAGDNAAIAAQRIEIDRLENAADDIKNEIRSHMPRRLMMAMERRDLLDILDFQDSIADVAADTPALNAVSFLPPMSRSLPRMDAFPCAAHDFLSATT